MPNYLKRGIFPSICLAKNSIKGNSIMNKQYKHFIFDFDGVLANSRAIACEEINQIVKRDYPMIPLANTQEDLALIYCGFLKTSLLRFGLNHNECEFFFNQHSSSMQKRCHEVEPFYEIVQLIAQVVHGKCSIVTSCYSDAVKAILSKSPFYTDSIFHDIQGRELKNNKTEKILDILNHQNILIEDAVYIGDLVSDILYCRNVPIDIAIVGFGYHPISYLSAFAPDYSLETQEDLKSFLVQRNRIRVA
jgi:phosphoglycolate phosphatase-like HAD superfamily hydrolase